MTGEPGSGSIEHMFEDGFDEEVLAAVAAGDLVLADLPNGDELWDSLTSAELAWLREAPQALPLRDVLTAGRSEPVSADLVGRLETIDPAALDDAGRVALAASWQRVADAALARRAEAVAALATSQVTSDWADAVRTAATELAAALALGTGAADLLAGSSVLLVSRLTRTLHLARRGDLSWEKAVSLAQATASLSDEQARAVEERVLPRSARRTPQQHRDAVRRAVDRVDPDGARRRREQATADVRLIATHHGSGMGELFAALPSEQLDTIWTAADCHARAAKAAGDPRPLDRLRVQALVDWAESFLAHGDSAVCDRAGHHDGGGAGADDLDTTDMDGLDDAGTGGSRPARHGRPVALRVLWDLSSLLGITEHCGELAASGATLPPGAMRDLLARGARVRRMLIDPGSGELVDLTPCSWVLPPAVGGAAGHLPPIQLGLVIDTAVRDALLTGETGALDDRTGRVVHRLADLLPHAEPALADLVRFPVTADSLDDDPDAARPKAALAEFVATRDRHPVNPAAGPTDAAAADIDHTVARSAGGRTVRDNLASLTRRWHVARTHGGWTYRRVGRHWEWTSPAGQTHLTAPYDYRLGP